MIGPNRFIQINSQADIDMILAKYPDDARPMKIGDTVEVRMPGRFVVDNEDLKFRHYEP